MSNASFDGEEIQACGEYTSFKSYLYVTDNDDREITRRILQARKTF